MRKSYFPTTYKNDNDLKNTLLFINKFRNELLIKLEKEWNLFNVESPRLSKLNSESNLRNINFDNKEDNLVYEFINFPCKYLNKILNYFQYDSHILGILTYYQNFERDCIISSNRFITKNIVDFRIKIESIERNNFQKLINFYYYKLINIISEIVQKISSKNESLNIRRNILEEKYIWENTNDFFKFYQLLKIDDYLKQKLIENNLIFFYNTRKVKTNLIMTLSDLDDEMENTQLLFFDKETNQILNLMQISLSKSNLNNDYIHFHINYDLLVMTLLGKQHIAEVVPGSWNEDLKKEVNKKKVSIL